MSFLRGLFGRPLLIQGQGSAVAMQPADTFSWHDAGDGAVHIDLPAALAGEIASAVRQIAGTYDVGDRLRFVVVRSVITNEVGVEVGVVG